MSCVLCKQPLKPSTGVTYKQVRFCYNCVIKYGSAEKAYKEYKRME